MRVHLVNPSDLSFGTAVITPRWLYVLAAATPARYGTPVIVDETLEPFDPASVASRRRRRHRHPHRQRAARVSPSGGCARARGAFVVFGGIHATLFPTKCREHGAAHAVVSGDGDLVWSAVLADCEAGSPQPRYDGGRIEGEAFSAARWDLLPADRYMWGSVQTRPRLPEALLVLLGVADRRPEAAAARRRRRRARNRGAAAQGLPIHPARRRQLLSGDAGRSRGRRAARATQSQLAVADGDSRRSDSS